MYKQQPASMFSIATIHSDAIIPKRATPGSAGMDLSACEDAVIPPGAWAAVGTGLIMQVPDDCYARVAPRSGLAFKHGIDTFAGVVDSDYVNEVKVILMNHGPNDFHVKKGDRIAQLILERIYNRDFSVVAPDQIKQKERTGGFGSTGVSAM